MWVKYKNGNANVMINKNNGTRIIRTEDDELDLNFPVNIDMMISERCSNGCEFCYANCTPDGKEAHFDWQFLDGLHAGTELAVNINSEIPNGFEEFLDRMYVKGVIVNITVHQNTFFKYIDKIREWDRSNLIHGIGLSLNDSSDKRLEAINYFPNLVVHVINGIFSERDFENIKQYKPKLLILGYKTKGRGINHIMNHTEDVDDNMRWLNSSLEKVKESVSVLSFDCLALDQIDAKRLVTDEEWETLYQGEDGTMTFAINLVRGTYSKSSTDTREFPILGCVEKMFDNVKKLS